MEARRKPSHRAVVHLRKDPDCGEFVGILDKLRNDLKQMRLDRNITQRQLAQLCGVNRNTIVRIEQGQHSTLFSIYLYARALDVDLALVLEMPTLPACPACRDHYSCSHRCLNCKRCPTDTCANNHCDECCRDLCPRCSLGDREVKTFPPDTVVQILEDDGEPKPYRSQHGVVVGFDPDLGWDAGGYTVEVDGEMKTYPPSRLRRVRSIAHRRKPA